MVAACKECDSSGAWSRLPRGTAAVGQTQVHEQLLFTFLQHLPTDVQDSCLTSVCLSDIDVKKPSAKAEEKKEKEKKVVNAMDAIQPHDSISNVSPN